MINYLNTLREIIKERDIPGGILYLATFLVSVFLISMPFCPWSQRQIMEKFHLRNDTFAAWAMAQFIPSMYNFANETWVSPIPFEGDFEADNRPDTVHYWTNHYPLRYASFSNEMRLNYKTLDWPVYFLVSSRYRDNELVSVYKLELVDGRTLKLARME